MTSAEDTSTAIYAGVRKRGTRAGKLRNDLHGVWIGDGLISCLLAAARGRLPCQESDLGAGLRFGWTATIGGVIDRDIRDVQLGYPTQHEWHFVGIFARFCRTVMRVVDGYVMHAIEDTVQRDLRLGPS